MFGAWSIIRSVLYLILNTDQFRSELGLEIIDNWSFAAVIVVAFTLLGLSLLLRLYVGLSARAEGSGKTRSCFYIIAACVMAAVTVVNFALYIPSLTTSALFTMVVSIVVDVTSMINLAELIISAIMLRKLTAQEAVRETDRKIAPEKGTKRGPDTVWPQLFPDDGLSGVLGPDLTDALMGEELPGPREKEQREDAAG